MAEQQHVFAEGLLATDLNWVAGPPGTELACCCKIRYRHQPLACRVRLRDGEVCEVRFAEAQKSVTLGQSVVFYQGDEVWGAAGFSRRCVRNHSKPREVLFLAFGLHQAGRAVGITDLELQVLSGFLEFFVLEHLVRQNDQ